MKETRPSLPSDILNTEAKLESGMSHTPLILAATPGSLGQGRGGAYAKSVVAFSSLGLLLPPPSPPLLWRITRYRYTTSYYIRSHITGKRRGLGGRKEGRRSNAER